jgi:hypothetical protein
MLGAGEATRTGQRDVDGLGGKSGVVRPRAIGCCEQVFDNFFEAFESLADGLFGVGRCGFQPCRNLVEPALLAAYPTQTEGLDVSVATDCGGIVARRVFESAERFVQRVAVKGQQMRNVFGCHA